MELEDVAGTPKRDTDLLARSVTPELIVALLEAAGDEQSWAKVEADAHSFLEERGIRLPDEVLLRTVPDSHIGSTEHIGPVVGLVHAGRYWCDRTIQLYVDVPKSGGQHLPVFVLCVGSK